MSAKTQKIEKLDKNFAAKPAGPKMRWADIRRFNLQGKGYGDTEHFYDRLPARAKGVVRDPVWELGHHSAGMAVEFITDAKTIAARWTLRRKNLAMNHMPATGVSGLDLYIRRGRQWRWVGIGRPADVSNEVALATGLAGRSARYRLYLPLYNGVESVEIGIPYGAKLSPAPADKHKPILFYGTSIVHGGCASRPGMAYPAILGRWLGRSHINLGFSGNGQMEPEVAELLADLDPAVYVLDALPNIGEPLVTQRVAPFVRILRAKRPKTPVVMVENITYPAVEFVRGRRDRIRQTNRAHLRAYRKLLKEGVKGLIYVPGGDLLGHDGEATVDGTHPTDVGFLRMAGVLEPYLRRALVR